MLQFFSTIIQRSLVVVIILELVDVIFHGKKNRNQGESILRKFFLSTSSIVHERQVIDVAEGTDMMNHILGKTTTKMKGLVTVGSLFFIRLC